MSVTYRAGAAVTVSFSLLDANAEPLTISAASYRVTDQDGVELVAPTVVTPEVGADTFDIVVSAGVNTLAGGATRALRQVELLLTTPAGVVALADTYFIEASETLVVMTNSFQTLPQALLLAAEIANIEAWETASDDRRRRALAEAFRNICKLQFRYSRKESQNYIGDRLWLPSSLLDLSVSEFGNLDSRFRMALREAQVIEADALLGGSDVSNLRRDGLMSATVGETSQMFRPGKPIDLPICVRALRALSGYVSWSKGLAR